MLFSLTSGVKAWYFLIVRIANGGKISFLYWVTSLTWCHSRRYFFFISTAYRIFDHSICNFEVTVDGTWPYQLMLEGLFYARLAVTKLRAVKIKVSKLVFILYTLFISIEAFSSISIPKLLKNSFLLRPPSIFIEVSLTEKHEMIENFLRT